MNKKVTELKTLEFFPTTSTKVNFIAGKINQEVPFVLTNSVIELVKDFNGSVIFNELLRINYILLNQLDIVPTGYLAHRNYVLHDTLSKDFKDKVDYFSIYREIYMEKYLEMQAFLIKITKLEYDKNNQVIKIKFERFQDISMVSNKFVENEDENDTSNHWVRSSKGMKGSIDIYVMDDMFPKKGVYSPFGLELYQTFKRIEKALLEVYNKYIFSLRDTVNY